MARQIDEVLGAGRYPTVQWVDNAGGVTRSIEQAVQIARRNGVHIPDDIQFFDVAPGSLGADTLAQYTRLSGRANDLVPWNAFYNLEGRIPVRIDSTILRSDQGIVGIIGHEMHELNTLRALFRTSLNGSMTLERLGRLIDPKLDGILHREAWDVSDVLIRAMRRAAQQ
jgi:hypothetical protein